MNIYWFIGNYYLITRIVAPPVELRPDIVIENGFDYCKFPEDPNASEMIRSGTPVPFESVVMRPPVINDNTVTGENPIISVTGTQGPTTTVEALPTPSPTPLPENFGLDNLKVEITKPENYDEGNIHVVFVGIGFGEDENILEFEEFTEIMAVNFEGVKIDFAYLKSPVNMDFEHAGVSVRFKDSEEQRLLARKIRQTYPMDSMLIGINTDADLGTSYYHKFNNFGFAMISMGDPHAPRDATHEIGHQLGLEDGYMEYLDSGAFPNSELFYANSMPVSLHDALVDLGYTPPLYEVGTCEGRPLYSFYESNNNIMRDYEPTYDNSWGNLMFTPVQIQIMNNDVERRK